MLLLDFIRRSLRIDQMGFSTHYGGLNGTAGIDLQLTQHHHNFNGLVATLVSLFWGLGKNTIWNQTKLMKLSTSRKQQQPTEQHHKAMSWSREELEGMARKAIQQLAKENGIKANAKVGCMSCLTVPFTRFVRGVRELAIAMSVLTGFNIFQISLTQPTPQMGNQ